MAGLYWVFRIVVYYVLPIIHIDEILTSFSYIFLRKIETSILKATILKVLTKPIAIALVFLVTLLLGTMQHISIIMRHNIKFLQIRPFITKTSFVYTFANSQNITIPFNISKKSCSFSYRWKCLYDSAIKFHLHNRF